LCETCKCEKIKLMSIKALFKRPIFLKVLILLSITPLGFYTKIYRGPFQEWVNYSLCDFLYEIFWCLVISILFPRMKIIRIAILVFIITGMLEFMQLWHPPFLEIIRTTFMGRTFIGNHFMWSDFGYYAAGCVAGYYILSAINRLKPE